LGLTGGDARSQEAAGGEEFGVEEGGTGGTADEVVGEQGELDVEEGAFADAADDGSHTLTGVDIAAGLGAIIALENENGLADGGGQGGHFRADLEIAQGLANFVERGNFLEAEGDALEMAVEHGNAVAVGAKAEAGIEETRAIPLAEKLLRLGFHFFLFAADEGDDVGVDIHGSDTRITSAGDGLQRDDEDFFEAEGISKRFEDEDETGGRTIGVGDDETGGVAAVFLLRGDGVEMGSVNFGNEQGDVGIHAMVLGVADDGIAGTREVFFGRAGDGRVEGGKNEVAVESRFETFNQKAASAVRDGAVEMPAGRFGISSARRTFGSGHFGKLEPRVSGKKLDEPLADDTGGAEDADAPFFGSAVWKWISHQWLRVVLAAISLGMKAHAAPPNTARSFEEGGRPIRVPRT